MHLLYGKYMRGSCIENWKKSKSVDYMRIIGSRLLESQNVKWTNYDHKNYYNYRKIILDGDRGN